jgi:cobalt/nickel transport system permease protein
MTLAFTLPPIADSPLRRLDARWKLAALLLTIAAAAVVRSWPAAVAALGLAMVLAVLGRLPPRWAATRIGLAALFVALFVAPLPFFWPSSPAWTFSPAGATAAAVLILKAAAVVALSLVLLATAPLEVNLKAAHALRVPGLLVQLTLLSYRYLFLLADELGRIRIALRVRGFRNRANVRSYRVVAGASAALLVRGWERAERVGQAMRCRGFDGRFRSLDDFRTRAVDVLAFALIVAAAAAVVLLDWLPL